MEYVSKIIMNLPTYLVLDINNCITKDYGVDKMQKYRKVSYCMPEETIIEIEIIQLMKSTQQIKISKSEIVENALIYSFSMFEEELENTDMLRAIVTPFIEPIVDTYTISVDVADKLDYYAHVLGISQAHLIMASIEFINN